MWFVRHWAVGAAAIGKGGGRGGGGGGGGGSVSALQLQRMDSLWTAWYHLQLLLTLTTVAGFMLQAMAYIACRVMYQYDHSVKRRMVCKLASCRHYPSGYSACG